MALLTHDPLGDNPHSHEFSDLYRSPKEDPSWAPAVYTYYDAKATILWVTCVPLCDDEALNNFTQVATISGSNPRWVSVKRAKEPEQMLPWTYDRETDSLSPIVEEKE